MELSDRHIYELWCFSKILQKHYGTCKKKKKKSHGGTIVPGPKT